jgi:prepilin peptidase CpaA
MSGIPPFIQFVLTAIVLIAGVSDIRSRRIPNWLTLTAVVLGFALNSFLFEWAGFWLALKGLGLATLIYFPFYLVRGMGAGDVKLMAGIGALVGPGVWFIIFVVTALLGLAFAVILTLLTGRVRKTVFNFGFMVKELLSFRAPYVSNEELDIKSGKSVGLPHGAVIALGTIGFFAAIRIWPA